MVKLLRAVLSLAAALVLWSPPIDAPLARGADAGAAIPAGALVAQPVLRTADPWLRGLTLNGDTLVS